MNTSKIIKAYIGAGTYSTTESITQGDYGYILQIEGAELPATYRVDFSNNRHEGEALTVYGNENGAEVPEELIATGKDIFAFYYYIGENFGKTAYTWKIPNDTRAKYGDRTPTPTQQDSIDQLIVRSNDAVDRAEDAEQAIEDMSVSAQTLAEGSSATVTKTEQEGVVHLEFGIPKGQTGDTPTIKASKTGKTTSIYVDGSEVAQIEDGTDGTNGDDGYSPTANVSKSGKVATITITDKNGTTSAQVEDGTDGTDGISPTVTITPITGGHRITITDADGEHSADVMDGTGNVDDVQINGTSIVENGVANVPIASANELGLVKIGNGVYVSHNDNKLYVLSASANDIKAGASFWGAIIPRTTHNATFYGLAKASGDTTQSQSSNAVGNYTEDAKSKISEMLGGSVSVSGTTPTIVAKSGIRYVCGEVATLDFTPSATGICDVVFTSGATATVLTVPSTIK